MNRIEKMKAINESSTVEFAYYPTQPTILKLGDCWYWINDTLGFEEGDEIPVEQLTDALCNEILNLLVETQQWQGGSWEGEDLNLYWEGQCDRNDYPELSKIEYGWDIEEEYEEA